MAKSSAQRQRESQARQKEQLGLEAFNEKNNAKNRRRQSIIKEKAILAGTEKSKMPTAVHKRNVRENRDNRLGEGTVQMEQHAKYADKQSRSVTFSKNVPLAIVNKWEGGALDVIKDRQQDVQDVGAKESDALALGKFSPDSVTLLLAMQKKSDVVLPGPEVVALLSSLSSTAKVNYKLVQRYMDDRNEKESLVKELVGKYMASPDIANKWVEEGALGLIKDHRQDVQDVGAKESDALTFLSDVVALGSESVAVLSAMQNKSDPVYRPEVVALLSSMHSNVKSAFELVQGYKDDRNEKESVIKELVGKYMASTEIIGTFSKNVSPDIAHECVEGALGLIKDHRQDVQDVGAKESDALALVSDVLRQDVVALQQSIVNKVDQFDEFTMQTLVNNSFLGKTAFELVQRYKDDRNEKESFVEELVGKYFTFTEIMSHYSQSDVDSQDGTTERSDVDVDGDYNEVDDDSSDNEDVYDQDDELNVIKSRELLEEDGQDSRSNEYGHWKQDDEQRLSYDQDNAFASPRNLENTLTSFSSSSSDRSMLIFRENTAQAPEHDYSNEEITEIERLDSCNNTFFGNENLCSDVSSSGRKSLLALQDQYGYSTNIAGLTAVVLGTGKKPIDSFDTELNAVSSNQGNNPDLGRQSRNQSAGSTALLGNITNTVGSDSRLLTPKNPSSPVSFTPMASLSSSQPMSPVIRKVKDQESSNASRMALEAYPLQSKGGVFSQENTGTSMLTYTRLHDVNHFTFDNGLPLVGKNGEEEMFVEFDSFGDHSICSPIVRMPPKKRIIARKEHEDVLVRGE